MTPAAPDVEMTVTLQPDDFDAYVDLNQRLRALLAPGSLSRGGMAATARRVAVTQFALPVLVTLGLGVLWGLPAERVPDLTAVFLLTWLGNAVAMQLIALSSERAALAELRENFAPLVAVPVQVQMDIEGFAVAGPGFSGRYSWSDGPVACRRGPSHLTVLHPRMPLLIPLRDAPPGVVERITRWLGGAVD